MMPVPEMPLTMLVTVMDRYKLESHEVKQRWREVYKFWLAEQMNVQHGWDTPGVMDAAYLRLVHVCEPNGPHKHATRLSATELALVHRKS